jgi:hypothetical protein
LVMVGSSRRLGLEKESSDAFRKEPTGKDGGEWCKGAAKRSGEAFILTLAAKIRYRLSRANLR